MHQNAALWLIFTGYALLPACQQLPDREKSDSRSEAIVRGDIAQKKLSLVFTGDEYGEGLDHVIQTLNDHSILGSFFFTGNFYRNPEFESPISKLRSEGHYLGAHSDRHLLYCDWENPDSLLVTKAEFRKDLEDNYREMKRFGISKEDAYYFLPPYEWYNDQIVEWTAEQDLQLINITYGTKSHADYTTPDMPNYQSSEAIFNSIIQHEEEFGLNGFILLIHPGVGPERQDKFYLYLDRLINYLKEKGYQFVPIHVLLEQ